MACECGFLKECPILPDHHASVFRNAMEVRLLSNGIEEHNFQVCITALRGCLQLLGNKKKV